MPYLLKKYSENTCSREELEELFGYIRLARGDENVQAYLRSEWEKAGTDDSPEAAEPDWERMYREVLTSGGVGEPSGRSRNQARSRRAWMRAAAAVLLLALLLPGLYYFYIRPDRQPFPQAATQRYSEDIAPGGDKAVLTLADGSRILLDSAATGLLASQGNTVIKKLQDGRLAYNSTRESSQAASPGGLAQEGISFNTITTPRGGQYRITLPDGSNVWLNAASSLKFPAAFTGPERRVELTGEAYFEIEKDASRPFLVHSGGQTVEVLGTHFNISAYKNDPAVRTTLLEGSVKVTERASGKSRILSPGQQASLAAGSGIRVMAADLALATAWKDGKFVFDGDNIQSIMRKIARWYDVEVIYEGDMGNKSFSGSVSRFVNVSDVLRKLELTGIIHFKIEERRITVMQ